MSYAAPQDLLDRYGAEELARLCTPAQYPRLDVDLFVVTVEGGDQSAWTPDEIAAANAALARLQVAVADACNDINMYLGVRDVLPLTPMPATLTRVACDLARYRLYNDAAPDEVAARYKDALRLLEQIAQGKLTLGTDTASTPATDTPAFFTGSKRFDDCTLNEAFSTRSDF